MPDVIESRRTLALNPTMTLRAAFSRPVFYVEGIDRAKPRERCAWHFDDAARTLTVWRNRYINVWWISIPYGAITGVTVAPLNQNAISRGLLGAQEVVTISYRDGNRDRRLVLGGKVGQLEKIRRMVSDRAPVNR